MVSVGDTVVSLHTLIPTIFWWGGGDSGPTQTQSSKSWPNFHFCGGGGLWTSTRFSQPKLGPTSQIVSHTLCVWRPISRPSPYICQGDIYINTTKVDPFLYDGSFGLKKCHNKIPWQFPDMGQMAKIPDIFSKFPEFSLTWRKFCFSPTFPWHVATMILEVTSFSIIKVIISRDLHAFHSTF